MLVLCHLFLLLPHAAAFLANAFIQTEDGLRHVKSDSKSISLILHKRSLSTNFGPDSTYLAANGLTCYVCRPGFYKKSDCNINGTTAVCERCPAGQYSTTYNIAIRCAYCSQHCPDINAEVHRVCNTTMDMSCRCRAGYYNQSIGSGEFRCLPHKKCPPGQEMQYAGTHDSDTQCMTCKTGTFSPVSSLDKCKPCTTCTSDQFAKVTCDGTTDTVCEYKGNDDLAPTIAISVIVACLAIAVIIVFLVLLRKGKLKKLANFCRNTQRETTEKATEMNGRFEHIPDKVTFRGTRLQNETMENGTWTQVFKRVSRDINVTEFKSAMRTLLAKVTTSENTVDTICYENRHETVQEQTYQCLLKWQKLCDEAYLNDIIDALAADNMTGLAEELEKKFPQLLRGRAGGVDTGNEYTDSD